MALQPSKIEGFRSQFTIGGVGDVIKNVVQSNHLGKKHPNACKDVRTLCRLCLVHIYFQDKIEKG